ncbi:HlyD family secretion protein [Sphingobacterium rhinopitheci]|uniref:HlyD family secretion protein n=1 Tax=Sphingobacterium rhinopitheci TaxID=2781960 RepID=UPI001F528AE5|nr:HlyD family efflux transporter periplasmic adaptor subunit [Sphingobacterium rhinopitheci]MCI0922099.1 HlyD family efflux transporter periplasmic adaptor subunit [Sphingobacterium rhinopitheci]
MKKTNIIYLILIAVIIITIISLPFIKIPISVSAPGVIRPQKENSKLISLVSGRVIESKINRNNQKVQKGDTLLVIFSNDLQNKLELNQNMEAEYNQHISDLKSLLARKYINIKSVLYKLELASMQQRISEVKSQATLAKLDLERNKILVKQGIISQAEFDKGKYTYEQLQNQISSIEKQQVAQWSSKLIELQQKHKSIESDLQSLHIDNENYVIKAPQSGTVTNFTGVQQGSQVIQGQEILDISPEENLIAECMIPPNAIGYIRKNQNVRFQIDTYNYNQWGFLNGTVQDIDYNLISNQQTGTYFKIRCNITANFLSLPNGDKVFVGKGNTFTARFYLVDRTLWQLLFDRADEIFNPNLSL